MATLTNAQGALLHISDAEVGLIADMQEQGWMAIPEELAPPVETPVVSQDTPKVPRRAKK